MGKKLFAVADALDAEDVKNIRVQLHLTQVEFAALVNVSKKTIERWESGEKQITGPIVTVVKLLQNDLLLADKLRIPKLQYPLRLWYMFHQEICSIIDVDERQRKVSVYNYTTDYMLKAFGRENNPTFEQYEEFLESRCFPRTRDKMKLMLRELDLPFYDPMLIIEKTQGRMAEDDFWLKVERGGLG